MVSKLKMLLVAALLCAFVVPVPVRAEEAVDESPSAMSAGQEQGNEGQAMTVSGVITSDYQIKGDDGVLYEIADTVAGNDLVQKVGAKVTVQGTVFEDGNFKVLVVESYKAK